MHMLQESSKKPTAWSDADVAHRSDGDKMRARIIAGISSLRVSGTPPTIRELADYLGVRSTGHLHYHIALLRKAEMLAPAHGKSRSLTFASTGVGAASEVDWLRNEVVFLRNQLQLKELTQP